MKEQINQLKLQLLACKEQLDKANSKSAQLEKMIKPLPNTKYEEKAVQTIQQDAVPFVVDVDKQSREVQPQTMEMQSNLETDISLSLRSEKDEIPKKFINQNYQENIFNSENTKYCQAESVPEEIKESSEEIK